MGEGRKAKPTQELALRTLFGSLAQSLEKKNSASVCLVHPPHISALLFTKKKAIASNSPVQQCMNLISS